MKSTLLIIGLLFIISSCNKNEPKFVDKPSVELVKYIIHLSDSKITEYSKYINDEFVEITTFYHYDSVIELIRKNAVDEIKLKRVYNLGSSCLADSSVSNNYSTQGLDVYWAQYKYVNGFLVEINAIWTGDDNSFDVHILNTIEDENIVSAFVEEPSGCTDYYHYNNMFNKIDLGFSNGIVGKSSKNLKEHIVWNKGCPCGPSSSIAFSEYTYELDSNGFVTKRVETYTPCYHVTDPGTVTRTINTTIYEYQFNQ